MSRRALSREVCRWVQRHAPDGRSKDMSCRVALGRPSQDGMLLAACAVDGPGQALVDRLDGCAARWGIEVYRRTLESGCRTETRQPGSANRIEASRALGPVVAWRMLNLTRIGRETPEVPRSGA